MSEPVQDWPTAPPGGRGIPRGRTAVAGRLIDYTELRVNERLSVPHAAERMRISLRTARRYEARLIAMGATRIGTGLALPALAGQDNT